MSPKFSHGEVHKIYMYMRTVVFLNPDDCKQPKMFGLNIFRLKFYPEYPQKQRKWDGRHWFH